MNHEETIGIPTILMRKELGQLTFECLVACGKVNVVAHIVDMPMVIPADGIVSSCRKAK